MAGAILALLLAESKLRSCRTPKMLHHRRTTGSTLGWPLMQFQNFMHAISKTMTMIFHETRPYTCRTALNEYSQVGNLSHVFVPIHRILLWPLHNPFPMPRSSAASQSEVHVLGSSVTVIVDIGVLHHMRIGSSIGGHHLCVRRLLWCMVWWRTCCRYWLSFWSKREDRWTKML